MKVLFLFESMAEQAKEYQGKYTRIHPTFLFDDIVRDNDTNKVYWINLKTLDGNTIVGNELRQEDCDFDFNM